MSQNTSQDFSLKKEFIDLQIELRKYLDETDAFTLHDIIKDPAVVHSLQDYINAYEELEDIKKIKRTLKKLHKIKRKNINLGAILESMESKCVDVVFEDALSGKPVEDKRIHFADSYEDTGFFTLKTVKPVKELSPKEKILGEFKEHFRRLELLRKMQIPVPVVNRNLSTSSSHTNLLKKIEKNGESTKSSNEITTNASFRNGILRNNGPMEKAHKTGTQAKRPNVSSPPPGEILKEDPNGSEKRE